MNPLTPAESQKLSRLLERCRALDDKGAYLERHRDYAKREAALDEISAVTGLINLFSSDLVAQAEKMLLDDSRASLTPATASQNLTSDLRSPDSH